MIAINEYFQSVASPFWDNFFLFVSMLTNEYLYIAVIAVIYLAIDKRKSVIMAVSVMTNMSVNFLLKDIIKIDRPYVLNENIVNKDPETGYGYSFPSGHSQFNSGFYTSLGYNFRLKKLYAFFLAFVILVAFSRVYLGVHSVVDVTAGILTGFLWSIIISVVASRVMENNKFILYLFSIIGLTNVILSGNVDAVKILLLYIGFVTGYIFEGKYINYCIPDKLSDKIINIVIFLIGIVLVQVLFEFIPNDNIERIKYLVTGLWASFLNPLICVKRKVKK